jgi:hypothetical protein
VCKVEMFQAVSSALESILPPPVHGLTLTLWLWCPVARPLLKHCL